MIMAKNSFNHVCSYLTLSEIKEAGLILTNFKACRSAKSLEFQCIMSSPITSLVDFMGVDVWDLSYGR